MVVVVVGGLGRYSSNKSSFFITAQRFDLAIFWDFEEDNFHNQYLHIFTLKFFFKSVKIYNVSTPPALKYA